MYTKKYQKSIVNNLNLQSKEEEFIKNMLTSESKESATLGLTLLLHLCKDDDIVETMMAEFMPYYSLWGSIKSTRKYERVVLFPLRYYWCNKDGVVNNCNK